jgi:hypothetical protein
MHMHLRPLPALLLIWALAGAALPAAEPGAARAPLASDAVRRLFADPPAEYTSAPLWVWNDLLTEEQIRTSLRELAEQGVKQAFVHPRPGLMTPYLSADWFRLWKVALNEAERLGMLIWIYDENSYPSGFAGGAVPEALPASRGLGLTIAESPKPPVWKEDLVAVHRLAGDRLESVTEAVRAGRALPAGRYATVTRQLAAPGPWYANRTYVNLLTPGVTAKFLELTLEPYRRELGAALGTRVPGIFTDEPHRPARRRAPLVRRFAGAVPAALGLCASRPPALARARCGRRAARALSLLPLAQRALHRALGEAVLRRLHRPRPRVHRALLGTHLAADQQRARQPGHGRLAAPPGHRHPDERIRRGAQRAIRQRPRGARNRLNRQPTRPRPQPLRALRCRRLGSAVRGHETHRRLAARPRLQHDQRAPHLHFAPRRSEARPPPELFIPRPLVARLPARGVAFRPADRRARPGPPD